MDSPANRISLSLMHMKPDSGTLSNIAAILKSSGRTIISRRNQEITYSIPPVLIAAEYEKLAKDD